MSAIDAIAMAAVVQYLFFGVLVARARARHGVRAPAVSGSEPFERIYRVQMNTLELLVVLLPTLYAAGRYWPPLLVAGAGAVYLAGRLIYWRAYVGDPSRRSLGFLLSAGPVFALAVATLAAALSGKGPA